MHLKESKLSWQIDGHYKIAVWVVQLHVEMRLVTNPNDIIFNLLKKPAIKLIMEAKERNKLLKITKKTCNYNNILPNMDNFKNSSNF